MAKMNLSPTKSNLIKVKQDLRLAREGYNLLEQKREIMVMELMSYMERVRKIEKELDELIFDAYETYKKAIKSQGRSNIKEFTKFNKSDFVLNKKSIKIIGLYLSSVEIQVEELKLQSSILLTPSIIDATSVKFFKLITVLCKMAEIRNIVWRLSQEVKKLQRRVNALEKVVIPETKETLKFIMETLEERERDEMFVRKMVKKRLEKANEVPKK